MTAAGTVIPGSAWPRPPGGWPLAIGTVPYQLSATPGANRPPSWLDGSNCQRFAYGALSLFGARCPPMRSSELWDDRQWTFPADVPRPLDLVLFNRDNTPYGAHIGLWMAPTEVLHLCRQVGRPVAWSLAEFLVHPRYRTLIGFKRPRALLPG